MQRYALLVVFALCGCASPVGDHEPNADGGVADNWATHPCDVRNLLSDFQHCGVCENLCSVDNADRCANGQCSCGLTGACQPEEDCKYGRCMRADPLGDICEFDPECPDGYGCVEGRCTFLHCLPFEVCDGIDNDCDNQTDEDPSGRPLSAWCYSGQGYPRPPCEAGSKVCQPNGEWSPCYGEMYPTSEQGAAACDGVDNNCDGCVDGYTQDGACLPQVNRGYDVLFLFDLSGSMSDTVADVALAMDGFSALFANNPEFDFALVTFPGKLYNDASYTILTDFTDFTTFHALLSGITEDNGGGSEPSWDVVYEACNAEMPVTWREGSVRIIIEFTDEAGQSYRDPPIDEVDMCAASQHGEVLAFFGARAYSLDFDNCGQWFPIGEPVDMQENLRSLIRNPCDQ